MIAFAIGSAECVMQDVTAAYALVPRPAFLVAVNAAAVVWPGSIHFASLHPELVPHWLTKRDALGLPEPEAIWCQEGKATPPPPLDHWRDAAGIVHTAMFRRAPSWGGSSGGFATQVALELGATHVICCGIPLNPQPHFNDPLRRAFDESHRYRRAWIERHKAGKLAGVRSMSGWTRQQLGGPDAKWLATTVPG